MNYPNDETGQALNRLRSDGSDMSRAMKIDFFIEIPDMGTGHKIAQAVAKDSYECSIEQDEDTQAWTCYASKLLVPSYENVVTEEKYLDSVAQKLGGKLDGFGSYGNV
ncbi:MAG: ribonuclease E inhibitor RraB [Verrucomicrobiota bacterium]